MMKKDDKFSGKGMNSDMYRFSLKLQCELGSGGTFLLLSRAALISTAHGMGCYPLSLGPPLPRTLVSIKNLERISQPYAGICRYM